MRLVSLPSWKGVAVLAALFPVFAVAGEWEEYKALKASMTSRRDVPSSRLPKWLNVREFQPRPSDDYLDTPQIAINPDATEYKHASQSAQLRNTRPATLTSTKR